MDLVDEIITRLQQEVPTLADRCHGAADWARLMREKKLPTRTPAAHVIPTGITPMSKEVGFVGLYDQKIASGYSVLLTLRSHDPEGQRALDGIEALFSQILAALAGWTPKAGGDVMRFAGLSLAAALTDAFVYKFDFTLPDYLRIDT